MSTYHAELTRGMLDSARRTLLEAGLRKEAFAELEVGGAFELPLVARRLAVRDDIDAVLCFGLVLKGETSHDVYIAQAVAAGIQQAALETDTPVLFGVLTCDTLEQARERATGAHDKGAEVARAALAAVAAMRAAPDAGARERRGEAGGVPAVKKRSRGRELALQFLYQLDLRGPELIEETTGFLAEQEPDREVREFAGRLVGGIHEHGSELDGVIAGVAENWEIDRMAVIDRNVLRIATFELLHCRDIPPKVAINEAIELGKRYSTQNTGAFVNGILDKIKSRFVDGAAQPEAGD